MLALVLTAFASPASLELGSTDLTLRIAQDVTVTAPTKGDVYALGGTLTIDAPVQGDVYGAATKVVITRRGSIAGDVVLAAESAQLDGPIQGGLKGAANQLVLNSRIEGAVEIELQTVVVGPKAHLGELAYEAPKREPALEAVAKGAVRYEATEEGDQGVTINLEW